MNESEFENQLKSQPRRRVPAHWREEILGAARAQAGAEAGPDRFDPQLDEATGDAGGRRAASWWREVFWPHPVAWAGLAAAWVLVLGLNRMTSGPGQGDALARLPDSRPTPPSPAMKVALAEQWKLRQELLRLNTAWEDLPPPAKQAPADARPRSQARPDAFIVTQASSPAERDPEAFRLRGAPKRRSGATAAIVIDIRGLLT